jgi:hypothetical protein
MKKQMEKTIRNYGKVYLKALSFRHCWDIEAKAAAYESRLREMYASDGFKAHSVYPTTNATHVYAVIAMCLELKALGLTDAEIIEAVNQGFARRRNFFRRLIRLIDLLPNSFEIAKKWNLSDHDKRVRDGSITYDRFDVGQDRIVYSISKCVYIEMFETYGIRGLCKIFCMTDTTSYENLRRHVTFIRHSDLSDGDACHDEIIRRRKAQ